MPGPRYRSWRRGCESERVACACLSLTKRLVQARVTRVARLYGNAPIFRRTDVYAGVRVGSFVRQRTDACAAGRYALRFERSLENINMNAMKLLGVVLLIGGILGLVYGGFTYTKETH